MNFQYPSPRSRCGDTRACSNNRQYSAATLIQHAALDADETVLRSLAAASTTAPASAAPHASAARLPTATESALPRRRAERIRLVYAVIACSPLGYAVSGFASWTSVRFTRSTFRRYSLRSASILCHSPLSAR